MLILDGDPEVAKGPYWVGIYSKNVKLSQYNFLKGKKSSVQSVNADF